MESKNYFIDFEKISNDLFEQQKKQFLEISINARDWQAAYKRFNISILTPKIEDNANKLTRLGKEVVNNFLTEWNSRYQLNKSKDRPEIFNELVEEIIEPAKKAETVKLLAEQHGLMAVLGFLGDEERKRNALQSSEKSNENHTKYQSPINWKGTNETEFVQLIYALYEAEYVEHEEKEITKLVEDFADLLNFPLGKNWHINLSTSIHKRNSDYIPPIFDNLKEAYKQFRLKKIERKKKI